MKENVTPGMRDLIPTQHSVGDTFRCEIVREERILIVDDKYERAASPVVMQESPDGLVLLPLVACLSSPWSPPKRLGRFASSGSLISTTAGT